MLKPETYIFLCLLAYRVAWRLRQALAARCHHQCRLRDDPEEPMVERLAEPTPLQQRALEFVRTHPVDDQFNS